MQGKPAAFSAFARATSLNYSARGAGQSLTDAELAEACTVLGHHLQGLNISGAFQLTSGELAAALRACRALRCLVADGSTLQDAAFAAALQRCEAAAKGVGRHDAAQGAISSSSGGGGGLGCGLPQASAGLALPPLRLLESLSLRGCLFLRGGLLADLADGCPALVSLDLADCGLSFK